MEGFSLLLMLLKFFFKCTIHFQKKFKLVEFCIEEQNGKEFFMCYFPENP